MFQNQEDAGGFSSRPQGGGLKWKNGKKGDFQTTTEGRNPQLIMSQTKRDRRAQPAPHQGGGGKVAGEEKKKVHMVSERVAAKKRFTAREEVWGNAKGVDHNVHMGKVSNGDELVRKKSGAKEGEKRKLGKKRDFSWVRQPSDLREENIPRFQKRGNIGGREKRCSCRHFKKKRPSSKDKGMVGVGGKNPW